MKKKLNKYFLPTLLFIFALTAAILFIMPTVLTITNSFMTEKEITANYGAMIESASADKKTYISEELNLKFIPDAVSIHQYLSVLFKSPDYLIKFWNSVILVVPITLFQVLLAAFTSYGFSRWQGRIREIIFFAYIILMLMPYQVTLVPNYLVSDYLGILGTRWAIILPGIFSPFSVFLLTKVMRRIPKAYFEAARLDGAGEWQIFWQICMPLSRSSMLSVGLLVFIDYWNMVEQPLILLSDEEQYPLSVFLSQINTGDVGLAFAVAVVYMIPALLLFLYGEEYLVEGITYSGGIKG
ncbi:MAG: carbohydrate ABC transporter permease [Oscillospiraceae bacterium]|nr:carbohydrate ABC transporter permease [Oscillospiraceae bacterium]MBR4101644.1 carbohydrate ABC transporter permease [Oscillospiraceae bacterium]MBR6618431.1 carbohydrate ABC transporter permease [Oscillospiraceae bacterium]